MPARTDLRQYVYSNVLLGPFRGTSRVRQAAREHCVEQKLLFVIGAGRHAEVIERNVRNTLPNVIHTEYIHHELIPQLSNLGE